ncbi:SMP-30/gluconolactonase/LRE family protein [Halioxenophilus aromaticivorans]|uniref:SMP-30/gluconolactonase/LRE family protein n=1 Tax=Halioxenophilus aromaticivorans TaxID=1306992 RepID=UPI0031E97D20
MKASNDCRVSFGHCATHPEWTLHRLTPASRLYGANGLRTGPDGLIYIAQVPGSQISTLDIATGVVGVASPMGGDIVAPDDIAFDSQGNLYATEITEGRVSVIDTLGKTRVLMGNMPCANPITIHQDRILTGECRPDGRLLELDKNGGEPRTLLENVPMPNAMEVGPDGKLYFPVMATNEIWRIDLDGGEPEIVAKGLGVPDSVKFDKDGFIVSTQVASGQVLRIDPATGEQTLLAQLSPGLDNCTFVGDRLFVSNINGSIHEIANGAATPVIDSGLQWPLGLAVATDDTLFVADGGFTYTLEQGQTMSLAGMLFSPGFPGYTRGVCAAQEGHWIVTTSNGEVSNYCPVKDTHEIIARGYDRLMDIARLSSGAIVTCEYQSGRLLLLDNNQEQVLSSDLHHPMGITTDEQDTIYVTESASGKILAYSGGRHHTVVDGLTCPEGIDYYNGRLYIADTGDKSVKVFDLNSRQLATIAENLPIGAPPGITPKPLKAVGVLAGPMIPFCGLCVNTKGDVILAGDAEGSVLKLSPTRE